MLQPSPRSSKRPGVVVTGTGEALEIPGYEVLEKVGSGGMASVYRARREDASIQVEAATDAAGRAPNADPASRSTEAPT